MILFSHIPFFFEVKKETDGENMIKTVLMSLLSVAALFIVTKLMGHKRYACGTGKFVRE